MPSPETTSIAGTEQSLNFARVVMGYGVDGLPSEEPEKFDIKSEVKRLAAERSIDPNTVEDFLSFEGGLTKAEKTAALTTATGLAVGVLLGSLLKGVPEIVNNIHLPIPTRLHNVFNWLHGTHSGSVDNPNALAHIPDLGFDVAIGAPLAGGLLRVLSLSGWRKSLGKFSDAARHLLDTGGETPDNSGVGLTYKMKHGYTALFVGGGDYLADQFLKQKPKDEVLTYAQGKQPNTPFWVKLSNNPTSAELAHALEVGDHSNIGEYMFMPVQADHMVLTPEGATDLSPSEMRLMVSNLRSTEASGGEAKKPIIIVGDRTQKSESATFNLDGSEVEGSRQIVTLDTIVRENEGVEVIDPTDLMLDWLMRSADGKSIRFRGSDDARGLYSPILLRKLQESNYTVTSQESFDFVYDLTDTKTIQESQGSGYCVLTVEAKEELLRRGIPETSIWCAPEEILRVMSRESQEQ